ncbi:hypothetical protein HZB89_01630 [archaeon]|nr:hypothetical protein [archaeon]
MQKLDGKLLMDLLNAYGVSGNEGEVRELLKKSIKPFVDSVEIDKMGNLIARKKGGRPRVMLAAHMDEVGLMVKSINPRHNNHQGNER